MTLLDYKKKFAYAHIFNEHHSEATIPALTRKKHRLEHGLYLGLPYAQKYFNENWDKMAIKQY